MVLVTEGQVADDSNECLQQRPVALLLQEPHKQGNSILLADSVLGHLGIWMTAGDMPQGAHGRLNDLLPTTSVTDSTQQCLEIEMNDDDLLLHGLEFWVKLLQWVRSTQLV